MCVNPTSTYFQSLIPPMESEAVSIMAIQTKVNFIIRGAEEVIDATFWGLWTGCFHCVVVHVLWSGLEYSRKKKQRREERRGWWWWGDKGGRGVGKRGEKQKTEEGVKKGERRRGRRAEKKNQVRLCFLFLVPLKSSLSSKHPWYFFRHWSSVESLINQT